MCEVGGSISLLEQQLRRLMQDYFFGSMDEYIEVGYAPTARAACRHCKEKIGKGELRVGESMDSDHFSHRYWYHLNCFTLKPLFAKIDPSKQIYKMDQLQEEDREAVAQHIGRQAKAMKNKRGKSRSGKKEKEKPLKVQSDEEETEPAPKRVTRSASKRSKSTKREPSPSPPAQTRGRRRRGASRSTRGSARKPKKPHTEQAYSAQQKQKYQELLQKYMEMTADKLKEILGLNNQPKTGKKAQLAQKCADGQLLGRIPQCSECGGGKLRFMWRVSLYHCPGYMDDEQFRHCNRHFTMKEVERTPWVLP